MRGFKKIVVCFHGYTSEGLNDYSTLALFYMKNGYNLLLVDERAHGMSRYENSGRNSFNDVTSYQPCVLSYNGHYQGNYIGIMVCINDSIMRVQKNLKLFQPDMVLLVPLVIESIYAKLKAAGDLLPKKLVAKQAFGGNLKTICSGGAYLNPEYVEKFAEYGITVLQGYGMTECSPVISNNLEWDNVVGSVGKLLPNCEAKIVDEEIWVKGSSVMMGYYKMPEETAETLQDGWLKTGDLGYIDEGNY